MPFDALNDLYREVILDHFQNPRHHEKVTSHDVEQEGFNPLCGDQIVIQLKFLDSKIVGIGCFGKGCSISQASGSILTEEVTGKTIAEVEKKISFFKDLMQGRLDIVEEGSDMEALLGVRKFPVRIKCALLHWTTLAEGIGFYKQKQGEFDAKR